MANPRKQETADTHELKTLSNTSCFASYFGSYYRWKVVVGIQYAYILTHDPWCSDNAIHAMIIQLVKPLSTSRASESRLSSRLSKSDMIRIIIVDDPSSSLLDLAS